MAEIEQRLEAYRNRFRLEGKIALVLGAASGIGKAAAEALAPLGATVICADKKKEGVETTASEIAAIGRAESHVVDAGDAEAVHFLAATIGMAGRKHHAVPGLHEERTECRSLSP